MKNIRTQEVKIMKVNEWEREGDGAKTDGEGFICFFVIGKPCCISSACESFLSDFNNRYFYQSMIRLVGE